MITENKIHMSAHAHTCTLTHSHFLSPAAQMQDNEVQVKKKK